jgi:hypothetical protein
MEDTGASGSGPLPAQLTPPSGKEVKQSPLLPRAPVTSSPTSHAGLQPPLSSTDPAAEPAKYRAAAMNVFLESPFLIPPRPDPNAGGKHHRPDGPPSRGPLRSAAVHLLYKSYIPENSAYISSI